MGVHRGSRGLQRLLGALGEPTRRSAYEVVRRAGRPLTRAEVADQLGIGVRLAAFHLDKLVDDGLLTADYARPPDRAGGPGAGRPAKRYAAGDTRFDVTVPPRRFDVAARILLAGLRQQDRGPFLVAAERFGREVARDHADRPLTDLLEDLGYEPRTDDGGTLVLVNCPFHELAEDARTETCTLNQAFLSGVAAAAGGERQAVLDPRPGCCCVRLPPAG